MKTERIFGVFYGQGETMGCLCRAVASLIFWLISWPKENNVRYFNRAEFLTTTFRWRIVFMNAKARSIRFRIGRNIDWALFDAFNKNVLGPTRRQLNAIPGDGNPLLNWRK